MRIALVPLVTLLVFAPVAALAAGSPPQNERVAACRADAEKLCAGVQPGKGRIVRCLEQNEAQVSQACKDVLPQRQSTKKSAPASVPKG